MAAKHPGSQAGSNQYVGDGDGVLTSHLLLLPRTLLQPSDWQQIAQAAEPDLIDLSELAGSLGKQQGEEGAGAGALLPGSFLVLLLIKVLCEDTLLAAVQR